MASHDEVTLDRLTLESILNKLDLDEIDSDILILRAVHELPFRDIGLIVGTVHRNLPYTEAAMRHRYKRLLKTIRSFLSRNDLI